MPDFLSTEALTALFQVIIIDLVLAGDNAIVIGLAASGLPQKQRTKAILMGIVAATVLRIVFTLFTTQLLQIIGLLLAGGILLLWVSWKMWRELRVSREIEQQATEALVEVDIDADGKIAGRAPGKTFAEAAWQIVIADVSMSLDNVLAVAGAAREHPYVLVFGLGLSIALMGVAASLIARLLQKHRWIAYMGLAVILYVALEMIYRGAHEVWPVVNTIANPSAIDTIGKLHSSALQKHTKGTFSGPLDLMAVGEAGPLAPPKPCPEAVFPRCAAVLLPMPA